MDDVSLTGTQADGSRIEVDGCDFLSMSDGMILRKNSYRKQRPPQPAGDRSDTT